MRTPPEYIIEFKDVLPGMLPVPYLPGWVVYKFDKLSNRYEHTGLIFRTKDQAESWAKTGIRPDDYWQIDWDTFPDSGCYFHHHPKDGGA